MKILQVSNFLTPVHGGSAEVPFQISKELAKRGHDVTIYTSDSRLEKPLIISGVDVQAFNTVFSLAGFNITPAMIKKAGKDIKKFDIIHLHNFRTYQNIIAHRYTKESGVPYLLQAHGSLATYFQKGLLKKTFDIAWGRKILQDANTVFAVTEFEAEQYRNAGIKQEKIKIVPHGVDLAEFSLDTNKGDFRKRFQIIDSQKIVLYLGRIHKMKGLDILVKAFTGLYQKRQDVKLVIAGPDDGYLSSLKKMVAELKIGDGVVFTGPLYGQEKLQAYTDADVCVLPSSYEIFGITILEAWACGKPVIVTDRCGLANAVKEGAGLVVPYDREELAKALLNIIDNESLRTGFGRQGRKLVEEKYNWSKITVQLENIYSQIKH